jgi:DNA-binding XRE family transcriptional regulator
MFHCERMGQPVPLVKDNVSPAPNFLRWHNGRMSQWPTQQQFQSDFRQRLRQLRGERSQADMAKALEIEHEAYKKYETRSMLPHHLLPRFAFMVGCDLSFLLTGKSEGRKIPARRQPSDEAVARSLSTPFMKGLATAPGRDAPRRRGSK